MTIKQLKEALEKIPESDLDKLVIIDTEGCTFNSHYTKLKRIRVSFEEGILIRENLYDMNVGLVLTIPDEDLIHSWESKE